jgi:hypothetical protein
MLRSASRSSTYCALISHAASPTPRLAERSIAASRDVALCVLASSAIDVSSACTLRASRPSRYESDAEEEHWHTGRGVRCAWRVRRDESG